MLRLICVIGDTLKRDGGGRQVDIVSITLNNANCVCLFAQQKAGGHGNDKSGTNIKRI